MKFLPTLPLFLCTLLAARAVPVAVNDSFTTDEDTVLRGGTVITTLLSANFEPSDADNLASGSWFYLDKVKNAQNGQTADTYPVDGAGASWKDLAFNPATSSVAGWKTAPLPIQGGGENALPGAPELLTGMSVNGVPYSVTTYLFRHTFTATAAQAAITSWKLHAMADDGAIFYLNGQEIARMDMNANQLSPAGAVTTLTATTATGNEDSYTDTTVTLSGKLVAGENVLAVELHQTLGSPDFTSTDAGIDMTLTPSSSDPLSGLVYADNVDGTNRANAADGDYDSSTGNPGSSINVVITRGGFGGGNGANVSGGWRKTIVLPAAGVVRVQCDARARGLNGLEDNEYAEAIFLVDGTRYAPAGRNYLVRQVGANPAASPGGNGNSDSGWATYTFDTALLTAGSHVFTFGGFGPRPSSENGDFDEAGQVNFDNVSLTMATSGGSLLANDTGGATTAVLDASPAHGTVVVNADGSFVYTPAVNYNGPDSFTYHATDGISSSNIATVSLTVNPVNDAPVAQADGPYAGTEETVLTVSAANGLLKNDTDVENQTLTAVLATQSTNGTAVVNADGSFTFTPAANFAGTTTFTYRASDGTAQSAPATVTLTFADTPDAPVAVNDSYTVVKNSPLVVSSLAGGTNTEEPIPYLSGWHYLDTIDITKRDQGTAWRTNAFVEDTTIWKVGAGQLGYGNGDEATIIADNPTAGFDSGATDKFAAYYFRRFLDLPVVTDIESVSIELNYDDAGVIFINGVEAGRTSNLQSSTTRPELAWDYYPGAGSGNDLKQTFAIPVSMLQPGANLIAVSIHQGTANSSDVSFDLRMRITRRVNAGLLSNDSDPDTGGTFTVDSVVAQPQHGTVAVNANGTFTYTPAIGYMGTDSFTYRLIDNTSRTSNVATVALTVVNGPNVPPVAVPDAYTAVEDTQLVVPVLTGVLANDTDAEGDSMTAVLDTPPTHGTVVLNTNGAFTYTPVADYSGADAFTYHATDGKNSTPVTVSITVTPVNDIPVAANDTYAGDPGQPLVIAAAQGVLANDTDADPGTILTAEVVTPPSSGTLVLNADGSFTFTAATGGTYVFTYRAKDAVSQSAPASVTISLNAVPTTGTDSYTTAEDTPFSVIASQGVLANDKDPENQMLTAVLGTTTTHGTLVLNANGSFTYTPVANYFGTDSFTYRAFDGIRYSVMTQANITITAVNDAPVAVADNYGVGLDTQLVISTAQGVLANDMDPDGPTLTVQLVATTTHGTLALAADGSFTYMPQTGYLGADAFNYKVTDGLLTSATVTVSLFVSGSNDVIRISEIMYNPPGGQTGLEFIEIKNTAAYPVNLGGWRFTAGVNYTFPAGRIIPGNGYLAIPADAAAFEAKYPSVSNFVVPGWGSASGLSNSGEKITLKDNTGVTIDSVEYSDSGEWAVHRVVNVWDHSNTGGQTPANGLDTDPSIEWYSSADPDPETGRVGGDSLQLKNFALSNNDGQNWTAAPPTPGAANTAVTEANSAPIITGVKHSPAVPNRNEQVNVTAKLTDELAAGVKGSVFYRTWLVSGQTPATAFVEVPMFDDGLHGDGPAGDGEFGAALPAQALNTVVEFYVSAKDAQNNTRTWPAPTLDVNGANPTQNLNCLYQVNEETWADNHPLYRLITTGQENYRYDVSRWSSSSNESINCTFIVTQGQKSEIRYQSSLRVRGNSSRSWNPRNWRLDLPGDNPWNGRTAFALNTKYVYSQYLSSRLQELIGIPGEHTSLVGVRLNGLNHALDSNQNGTFGYYADFVPMGGELIDMEFPFDKGGNGYAKIRGSSPWSVQSLPTVGANGYAEGGYINQGWSKKSNSTANDWTDLDAWLKSVNNATIANFDTATASTLDLDEWVKWWAFTAIINHAETNPSNGDDDDYSIYFGETDRRAKIIAHDFDTCFNLSTIGLADETAPATGTIFQATANPWPQGDSATVPQMDKFYRNPVTGRKYKAALKRQLETIFEKTYFDALVDTQLPPSLMGATLPNGNTVSPNGDAIRAAIKTFMDTRRTTIATFLPTAFTATTTLAVQNGYPTATTASNLGSLGGAIDPVRTAKVTVNGITVTHSPYDNTWSAGTALTLTPGLNPLVCTAWDEAGNAFATQMVTIYLEATGTSKSGTLAANEAWTAAGGPWNVTGNLTVPSGVTLTISPGASVQIASGAGITVAAGGRILAEGTIAAPIQFDRPPSATTNWTGITVNGGGTAPENRFVNVVIGHNNSTAIHTQNGANVIIDRVTFLNTAVQYLSLDASSFIVSNCVFPPATASFEPVHGTGGIATGGRGIVRDCIFGKPQGYNDSMDFTGGNRPGPILQVFNCVFNGSDDDALDLDSTDAWVEGCVFLHIHRNGSSPDSSSGISGGDDNGAKSEITAIRNLFYDCDQAVTLKMGNSFYFIQNTVVHTTKTGGIDGASGAVNFADEGTTIGAGALIEGNIFYDIEALVRNYNPASSTVTFNNNILPSAWTGPGTGNVVADPLLPLSLISSVTTATAEEVRAAFKLPENSPARGTGMQGRDKGGLVPEGIAVALLRFIPATSAPLVLNPGPAAALTLTGQPSWNSGYVSYRWSLDGGAVSSETPFTTPLTFTSLANGTHTLTIEGKRDSGDWQATPSVFTWTTGSTAPTVWINEVLAANTTAFTLGSTRPDIIELQNYGTEAVSLAGWTISDDTDNPAKYTLPAGTSIPAGGYLALMADDLPSQAGELHTGFGLSAGGETVRLYRPSAVLVDSVSFGPQIVNFSVARAPATGTWVLSVPTPGAANTPYNGGLSSGDNVRINEWLASNDIIVDSDFVELYNPGAKPADLSGYALTDNYTNFPLALSSGDSSVYVLPPLSFIGAGGFTVLSANGSNGPDTLTFNLSRIHDSLAFVSPSGVDLDHVVVSPGLEDRSEGRATDGASTFAYFTIPTPGLSNSTNVSSETDLLNGLRITEMMFDPPGSNQAEYIELKNIGTTTLTLTGISFTSGITYTFPTLTVAGGGYVVITSDLTRFTAQFPGVTATQWSSGKLDNSGESVRIETPTYSLGILDFRYEGTWYPETRGGAALEIVNPLAARSSWNIRESWQPAAPSPGGPSAFGVIAPQDLSVEMSVPAVLHGYVFPGPQASVTVAWTKVSGPGTVVFNAPASKDTDVTFSSPGVYELRLTASGPGGSPSVSDTVIVTVTGDTGETLAAWTTRLLSGYSAANRAPGADADGDGVPNLVEYAMGTDPTTRTAGPEVIVSSGRLALRYTRSKSISSAVQLIPQISDDMVTWREGSTYVTQTVTSDTATSQTIVASDTAAAGASSKKYLRLKVVSP